MSKSRNKPDITSENVKTTKEYADALDKLNQSLDEVNKSIPAFANGADAGLKAVASKLPDLVNSMMKLNQQNKELAANGQKPISVFSQLASSMFS